MQHTPHEPMTTRMSTKGQVVIPRAAREMLGVRDGTQFSIHVEVDGYKLVPQTQKTLKDFFNLCLKMRSESGLSTDDITNDMLNQSIGEMLLADDKRTTSPRAPKHRSPKKPR